LNYRYKSIGKQTGGGVFEYFANGVGKLPIPVIDLVAQQPFIDLADRMLSLQSELRHQRVHFRNLLSDSLGGAKIPDKRFDDINDFRDFVGEMNKQMRPIPINELDAWRDAFFARKGKVSALLESVRQTDADIDQMVYDLYGLVPADIAVVDGNRNTGLLE